MSTTYDVIVVGARCAGSPLAMLLARAGHRVLLVDRATFPSDTMSTHLVHPPAADALARWGLLDRVLATGCPAFSRYSFDFGPVTIAGTPRPAGDTAVACGPRRTVLDALLLEAAAEAGAEVREGFTVDEIVLEDGRVTGVRGGSVTEHARLVVGADGRASLVARALGLPSYHDAPALAAAYYAYWSDLPTDGVETYVLGEDGRGWSAIPTNDGLTCVVVGWPESQFATNRSDVEGAYLRSFDLVPGFAERIRGARQETRLVGSGTLRGFFRVPYGPGWALVGDAGYHKHPITAFGITDAFRDAEALAAAFGSDEAMGAWHRMRDASSLPMYELTCDFATLEPPEPEMQALFGAMQGNQAAMDDFVSVMAGTLAPPEFFAAENIGRIVAGAGVR
jgi:flavin-dependent dehydrogenase